MTGRAQREQALEQSPRTTESTNPVISVIVPEYNELTRQGKEFDLEVRRFMDLSNSYDVYLVDDASDDGSWERIQEISAERPNRLHPLRMETNGKKVMAVKTAVTNTKTEYVMLIDFDSWVIDPESIPKIIERFESRPLLAGVCLKLMPEGKSLLFRFQDIEYAIARKVFNTYTTSQRKLRCVPGAAGIWRRSVLLETLKEHSGKHNGDDLETTAIALRKGYWVEYVPLVAVKTNVPKGARALFDQRKRWELGALETFGKERKFYLSQVRNPKSRLGHVTLLDWYGWLSTILSPLLIVNGILHPQMFLTYFCFELLLETTLVYYCRDELLDKDQFALVPLLPIYRFFAMAPRIAAMLEYLRERRPGPRTSPSQEPYYSHPVRSVSTGELFFERSSAPLYTYFAR